MKRIYIATKNRHKLQEFSKLLPSDFGEVTALPDGLPDSPETESSFELNALQKATYYAQFCDGWMLADDSGLCVDALAGSPGIFSARYAGEHASTEQNNQKLLKELSGVQMNERTASFVCALAVWNAQKNTGLVVRGTISGVILTSASGVNGFGYDPLFYVPDYQLTLAQMSDEQKNQVSHRAGALARLVPLLQAVFEKLNHR